MSYLFELDVGTTAGVLASAVTESAVIGTATETLATLGLPAQNVVSLQDNIGVTYVMTYLFGFSLVIFFTTVIAPGLPGVTLEGARAV